MQDHSCWWTRRRESELSRAQGRINGAGLSRAVLEATGVHLGHELMARASVDAKETEDESFTIGPWSGTLHDGCFVEFEANEPALRAAVVHANLALHGFYCGIPSNPTSVERIAGSWSEGTVLRFRSIPAERIIQLKRFPMGSGWIARLRAPMETLVAGAA